MRERYRFSNWECSTTMGNGFIFVQRVEAPHVFGVVRAQTDNPFMPMEPYVVYNPVRVDGVISAGSVIDLHPASVQLTLDQMR